MMHFRKSMLGVLSLATLLAACSEQGPERAATPFEPVEALTTTPQAQRLYVCKDGPYDTYNFEASATGGDLLYTSFTVVATGVVETACKKIWSSYEGMAPASVTVSELVPEGMQVDSIVIARTDASGALIFPYTLLTGPTSATVDGLDFSNGAYIAFFNSDKPDEPEEPGTEGCTPGYWKQRHHFGNWVGYTPSTPFSAVFENAFPGKTLLDVLGQGGGGLTALGRHTVAALLNASGAVEYGMTAQQVIDAFNAAYPGGDYEGLKGTFEDGNERGCPLGRAD